MAADNTLQIILEAATTAFEASVKKSQQSVQQLGDAVVKSEQTVKDFNTASNVAAGGAVALGQNLAQLANQVATLVTSTSSAAAQMNAMTTALQHTATAGHAAAAGHVAAGHAAEGHGKTLAGVVHGIEEAGKSIHGLWGEIAEAYAGGRIIEFFKTFVEAAADAQARVATLSVALDNSGNAAEGTGEKLNEFAEQLAKASGYGLPKVVQGLSAFINEGMSANQAMYASGLAADVAAGKHLDLAGTQQILARAISTGSGAGLARLGIAIKGVDLRTASLDTIMGKLADTFRGQAAQHAQTYEGALERLNIQVEEMKASFGRDFLNALTAVANGMNYAAAVVSAMSPGMRELVEIVVVATSAFLALSLIAPLFISGFEAMIKITEALGVAFEFLAANPVVIIIGALALCGVAIYELITHAKQLEGAFSAAVKNITTVVKAMVDFVLAQFASLGKGFDGLFKLMRGDTSGLKEMQDGFGEWARRGDEATKHVGDSVMGMGKRVGSSIADFFKIGPIDIGAKMPVVPNPGGWSEFNRPKKEKKQHEAHEPHVTPVDPEQDELADLKDNIADKLAGSKDKVDAVKASLEGLVVAEDSLKAAMDDGKASLAQHEAQLSLLNHQYEQHIALGKALADQQNVERGAVVSLTAERAKIAGQMRSNAAQLASAKAAYAHGGSDDQKKTEAEALNKATAANEKAKEQYRSLNSEIRSHAAAIRGLTTEIQRASADAQQDFIKRNEDEKQYHAQAIARIEKQMALQRAQREEASAKASDARDVAAAQADVQTDALTGARKPRKRGAAEQDTVDTAKGTRDNAQALVDETVALLKLAKGTEEVEKYQQQLATATRSLETADKSLTIAQIQLGDATKPPATALQQLTAKVISSVPEIQTFIDAISRGESPMQALADVFVQIFERTQTFKDIVTILSNIFVVIARVLDAIFLPVVKLLAAILTDVVNIFIALWNAVATIISLLGIHITKLQYINSLLDNLSGSGIKPLLDVVHDLPTPKEYGAGKWGPLTSGANGTGQFGGLTNALNANTTSQGGVLAGLLKLVAVMGIIGILFPSSGIGSFIDGLFKNIVSSASSFISSIGSTFQNLWNKLPGWAQGLAQIGVGVDLLTSKTPGLVGFLEHVAGALLTLNGVLTEFGTSIEGVIKGLLSWIQGGGQGGFGGLLSKIAGAGRGGGLSSNPNSSNWDPASAYSNGGATDPYSSDTSPNLGNSADPNATNWDPASAYAGSDPTAGGLAYGNGSSSDWGSGTSLDSGYSGANAQSSDFGSWGTSGSSLNVGAGLGGAAMGAGFGALLGQVFGGGTHTTNGEVGGAVGGGIGGLVGGPIGSLVGAGLGSLIGSLFGHADNKASMPDKYDSQRFTQYVGELQGSAGTAYGPAYDPASDQIQQTLGMPMLNAIQSWVKANENSPNPQVQQLAQQLKGQYGDTSQGLAFGHDIGQESVIGGSLSGTYVTIHNAAASAIQQIAGLVSAIQSQTASPTSQYSGGYSSYAPSNSTRYTSSLIQNNNIGAINGSSLVQVNNTIGNWLAVAARTQRYTV